MKERFSDHMADEMRSGNVLKNDLNKFLNLNKFLKPVFKTGGGGGIFLLLLLFSLSLSQKNIHFSP
jgi:hypothetical protein